MNMEKMLSVNQKRTNKPSKNKKKGPLKVVYITNPIKFKTSASEFRALVQELTGQDATDTPETVVDGGGEVADAVNDNINVCSAEEEIVKIRQPMNYGEVPERGSDSVIGSGNDVFVCPQIIGNLSGLVGSNLLDVLDIAR